MVRQEDVFIAFARLIADIHSLEDSLTAETADPELTPMQSRLLQVAYFSGPSSLSSLSRCLNSNLPNTSREVRKLTEKGLVRKDASDQDRRSVRIGLTGTGKKNVESFLERLMSEYFHRRPIEMEPSERAEILDAIAVLGNKVIKPALNQSPSKTDIPDKIPS